MKPLVIPLLFLLGIVTFLAVNRSSKSNEVTNPRVLASVLPCHPDYDALMAIYDATGGPGWSNMTNWGLDCDVCNWDNVRCDGNDRVSYLILQFDLVGAIPEELGNLTELDTLRIYNNEVTSIPASIGNLSKLKYLEVAFEPLITEIPKEVGLLPNLEILYYNYTGAKSLPSELGNISTLKYLDFEGAELIGTIPTSFSNLLNLETLNLYGNMLSGPLPCILGDLPKLTEVQLGDNDFEGCFPSSYAAFCNLPSNKISFEANFNLDQFQNFCDGGNCPYAENIIQSDYSAPLCSGELVQLSTPPAITTIWSNGAEQSNIEVQIWSDTSFSVILYDSFGCYIMDQITLSVYDMPNVSAEISNASPQGSDGAIALTITGGQTNFIFSWSNGSTDANLNNVEAGTYNLEIIDDNQCKSVYTFEVGISCLPIGTPCDDGDPTTFEDQEDGSCNCAGTPCTEINTNLTVNHISCSGASNGSIATAPTGGTAPYTISWSTGSTDLEISDLAPDIYLVTVTDANGCSVVDSATIIQSTALTTEIIGSDESSPGAADGAANLSVSGGTLPYSYLWSNGQTTEDLTALGGGTYTCTITDANGCQQVNQVVIGVGCPAVATPCDDGDPTTFDDQEDGSCKCAGTPCPAISTNLTVTDISCFGLADGSIATAPTGGASPYTINWSTGSTDLEISNLAPDTYFVTVTDANGCSVVDSATTIQPTALTTEIIGTDESSPGTADGSAVLSVSGGTLPYSYLWSNGQTSEDLAGLTAGTYSCTITDANACQKVDQIQILAGCPAAGTPCDDWDPTTFGDQEDGNCNCAGTPCPAINTNLTATDISCSGTSDGSIATAPAGGTSPYTISWSTGSTDLEISDLQADTYLVTVTDANGCSVFDSATINQPVALAFETIGTDESYSGAADGAADLSVEGGTVPYSYLWSNGQTTEDLTALGGGTYNCTITDANGCQQVNQIIIGVGCQASGTPCDDGDLMTFDDQEDGNCNCAGTPCPAINTNLTATDISCHGASDGSIATAPTGGAAPYTISWSTGSTDLEITNLAPDTYLVTVTDANGCSVVDSATIIQPAALATEIIGTDESSPGAADGSAVLSVSGGTLPYSHVWSNGQTSEDLTGLTDGTYSCTITDANGCQQVNQVIIGEGCHAGGTPCDDGDPTTFDDQEDGSCNCSGNPCPTITTNLMTTDISCSGDSDGSIATAPTGGTLPYTFTWSTGSIDLEISNLAPDTYLVTVTDANGCSIVDNSTINQPTALITEIIGTDESYSGAADGAAELSVGGGTVPYSYLWSNGQTTEDLTALSGGNYACTISDATGCQQVNQIVIGVGCQASGTPCDDGDPTTFDDQEDGSCNCAGTPCPTINTNLTATDISCHGASDGSIATAPTGGTAPYTISWSTGSTELEISDLAPDIYLVTVTDANRCSVVDSATINQPIALASEIIGTDESYSGAADGSAVLSVSGGTLPYSYLWSNGQTSEDLTGLTAGTYSCTITDANACQKVDQIQILAGCPAAGTPCDDWDPTTFDDQEDGSCNCAGTPCPAINTNLTTTDISCSGASDGTIATAPTGGAIPYTISWSTGSTDLEISDLAPDIYLVTVTDANGCSVFDSATINQPIALATEIIGTDESSPGAVDGAANLSVSGGTLPYSYLWSNGQTTENLTGLTSGTYSCTITDANGCQQVNQVIIGVGCQASGTPCDDRDPTTFDDQEDGSCNCAGTPCPTINTNLTATDISCHGASDGSIATAPVGGTAPYTISWSTGNTDLEISNLTPDTYLVTVTDANGCSVVDSATITQPTALATEIIGTDESSPGAADGAANLSVSGGTPPYSYLWSTGQTTEEIENLSGNQYYSVTVIGEGGCTITDSIYIAEFICAGLQTEEFHVEVFSEGSCEGNGELQIIGPVLSPAFSYRLGGGATQESPVFKNLHSGSYQPMIFDVRSGCSIVLPEINIGEELVPDIITISPSSCDHSSGVIKLNSSQRGSLAMSTDGPWFEDKITSLSPGTYSIYSRDPGSGCVTFAGDFIVMSAIDPSAFLSIEIHHAYCGSERGTINFSPNSDISYSLDDGNSWYINEREFSVTPGSYEVLLKTEDSCIIQYDDIEIKGQNQLVPIVQVEPPSSCSSADGEIRMALSTTDAIFSIDGLFWQKSGNFTGLQPGKYKVLFASDNGDCRDSVFADLFTVDTSLTINVQEQLDPSCHGAADGFLALEDSGGLGRFRWQWSNGSAGQQVGRLTSGLYEVFVTNEENCGQSLLLELKDPPKLRLDLPEIDSMRNCLGQTVPIHLSDTSLNYAWYRNSQLLSQENSVEIAHEGAYTVVGRDVHGCEVQDSFEITYSDDLFIANFLLSTSVVMGEEVQAIEISWPVPDKVQWIVEGGSIVDSFLNQSTFVFESPGAYYVRLKAMKDGCISTIEKLIMVVESADQILIPAIISEEIRIQLYPNPNLGNFNLLVELGSEADLQIRIYDEQARLIYSDQKEKVLILSDNIDISGSTPGIYTLVAQSETQWRSVSFLLD